jgi:hypothetical protein
MMAVADTLRNTGGANLGRLLAHPTASAPCKSLNAVVSLQVSDHAQ